jgi:uncharacterized membrane protein YhiD involved in acid resistance
MNDFESLFRQLDATGMAPPPTLEGLVLSLLLALTLGQLTAWVYTKTHAGLSYSRSFCQSLVYLMVIATLVMFVIGNNVVAAFGLMGALAIIRFRNVLKDTRDTAFVFMTLVLGMAIGSQRIAVALVGGAFLLLLSVWLHFTRFGVRSHFDGHLSYRMSEPQDGTRVGDLLDRVFTRYCQDLRVVTVHDSGDQVEYVQQVRLRDRKRGNELVQDMRGVDGIGDVTLVLRDESIEI